MERMEDLRIGQSLSCRYTI